MTRNSRIIAPFIWFLVSCLFFEGCSLFQKRPAPKIPFFKKTASPINDLLTRAHSIKNISIYGRFKLEKGGERIQSVKLRCWLMTDDGEKRLRLRGYGPFGIALFDLLSDGKRAYIYLPRSQRLYSGKGFFTKFGKVDVGLAIRLIEALLNPWSPLRDKDTTNVYCSQKGRICFKEKILSKTFRLIYFEDTLAPERFYSRDIFISFGYEKDFFESNYPKKINFFIKDGPVKGNLVIYEVRFNQRLDERLFDFEKFLSFIKKRL